MNASQKIVIIGAGIAGLSAGVYAQKKWLQKQYLRNAFRTGWIGHSLETQRIHH